VLGARFDAVDAEMDALQGALPVLRQQALGCVQIVLPVKTVHTLSQ
jgi:hypothetical protein